MDSGIPKGGSCIIANLSLGRVVARNAKIAATFWTRLKGLLGKTHLPPTDGLLLKKCGSIHTFFMKFPIDVAYLDKNMVVAAIYPAVRPWRTLPGARGGVHTLEMAAGAFSLAGLEVGHRLEVRPK